MAETLRGRLVWQPSGKDKVRRVVFPTKKGLSQPTFFPPDQLAAALREAAEEVEVDLELDAGKPVRIRPVGEAWAAAAAPAPTAAAPGQDGGGGRGSRWRGPQRDRGGAGGERRGGDRGHEGGSRRRAEQDRRPERRQDRPPQGQPRPQGEFYNPYNFIPAVPPLTADKAQKLKADLGQQERAHLGERAPADLDGIAQGAPCGHDRYREGRWTGRIGIEIVAETPLLIPDAARARPHPDNKDHLVFDLRTYRDERFGEERPYLPPTSLKGALRAAYEAVTNSRLGVFAGHEDKLAQRMEARAGLAMIPARIGDDGNRLELWPGTGSVPTRPGEPMYAAWLPRYRKGTPGLAPWAVKHHGSGKLPGHTEAVVCWLEMFRHAQRRFTYWRVRAIAPAAVGSGLPRPEPSDRPFGAHEPVRGQALLFARGWVCVTNQNINSKHDERVFFVRDGDRPLTLLEDSADVRQLAPDWRNLVANYQDLHADEIRKRDQAGRKPWDYLGSEPGKTAWSRHVYERAGRELTPGSLCYARLGEDGGVAGLYPVMISRELAECAPDALLPHELRPARRRQGADLKERLRELSPADRVFGWVSQQGDGAWRGQLRVGPVACETARRDAIEAFGEDGLPLAILSTPKPQQARFYVATDKTGAKQRDGAPKDEVAYAAGKGLRGRKAYPHHRHADAVEGYWSREGAEHDAALDIPAGEETDRPDRLAGNGFREYVRRQGYETERDGSPKRNRHGDIEGLPSRDDQNRSIKAWVKPETRFTSWIEVTNLSAAELGALLWLLSLNDGDEAAAGPLFHRLGGGKPLGFGSARIAVTKLDLADGEALAEEYRSLTLAFDSTRGRRIAYPPPAADDGDAPEDGDAPALRAALPQEALDAIRAFKAAVVAAYGEGGGTAGLSEEEPAPRFKAVRLIAAFLQAARGHADLPVHYPRNGPAPDPKGENFRWFGDNERGPRLALDELWRPEGLPLRPGAGG